MAHRSQPTQNIASEANHPEQQDPKPKAAGRMPPAGPHADPRLTDAMKTPGAGTLPENDDDDVGAGAG
ncbi:MAG TPA: hypothetical protein VMP03_12420 [Methylomirabilota bacterium]|nr:hypothetical protein [Methylomirabilota bacterium]